MTEPRALVQLSWADLVGCVQFKAVAALNVFRILVAAYAVTRTLIFQGPSLCSTMTY